MLGMIICQSFSQKSTFSKMTGIIRFYCHKLEQNCTPAFAVSHYIIVRQLMGQHTLTMSVGLNKPGATQENLLNFLYRPNLLIQVSQGALFISSTSVSRHCSDLNRETTDNANHQLMISSSDGLLARSVTSVARNKLCQLTMYIMLSKTLCELGQERNVTLFEVTEYGKKSVHGL